jgi:hypothetical protein
MAIVIRGVQVVRTGPSSVRVNMTPFKGTDGSAAPAIMLPPELLRAVCNSVLDEYNALARMPFAPGVPR